MEPHDYWIYYLNIDFTSSVWNVCHRVADIPPKKHPQRRGARRNSCFHKLLSARGWGFSPATLNVVPGYFHWKKEKKQNQKISLADPSNVGAARKVFPHLSQRTITHYCISLFPIVSWLGYRTNCLLGLGEVPSCLIPRLLVVFTRQLRNLSDNPDLSLHNIESFARLLCMHHKA